MKWRIKKQFLQKYQKEQPRKDEVIIRDVEEETPMVISPEKAKSTIFSTNSEVTNLDFLSQEDDETQEVPISTSFCFPSFDELSTDMCYSFSLAPFYPF